MNEHHSFPAERPAGKPSDHPTTAVGRVGVLLVNLGTPEATDVATMRSYLREFLWDRRVIEVARPIWWAILNLIILRTRPKRSGEAYERIWNRELDESPLRTITRAQAEKLQAALGSAALGSAALGSAALGSAGGRIVVDWAMRYGKPPIGERIDALMRQGCDRILVVPLYPQYSAATTGTVIDKLGEAFAAMRWQPAVRTLPPYYDHPLYIEALARSIEESLAKLDFEPELVLASYHGLPKEYLLKGDPYYCQCHKTHRLLAERLGWGEDRFRLVFQSRFGRAEWLKPYTMETVEELAKGGVKRLAVVMPGFAADCIETLEEIGMQNAEVFQEHGGTHFAAIPCLNDSAGGMALIEALVRNELMGWV